MTNSKRIAGLVGPSLAALTLTELINLDIWTHTPAVVVYLSGTLLFVAGLSIVRVHNHWTTRWPVLVTIYRMVCLTRRAGQDDGSGICSATRATHHDPIPMDPRDARNRECSDCQSLLWSRHDGRITEPNPFLGGKRSRDDSHWMGISVAGGRLGLLSFSRS